MAGGATLNFNIGVLGHVDSGKTSLVKAISTTASTACFDKNPQSVERGITLDLGFSSFQCPLPDQIKSAGYSRLQVTLVDCPGHASLIKTIIGGAQIIDLMVLVVDCTKGIQTQTAECLVIGQIVCSSMLVVLNKTDLLPPEKSVAMLEKMTKKLKLTFQKTKFKEVEIVPVSARPGGPDSNSIPEGLDRLVSAIQRHSYVPSRVRGGAALLSVDHCFSIKGQGTVMTGTVLQGEVKVGDSLEIPALNETRKVKSIQMFRVSVDKIHGGDRAGICVTQFDPKLLERGLVCTPGSVPSTWAVLASMERIQFFKGEVKSKAKFHISLGHETVLAKLTLLHGGVSSSSAKDTFDFSPEYHYQELVEDGGEAVQGGQYVLLELERCVPVVPGAVLIGSRLDTDPNSGLCRLAFHGKVLWMASNKEREKVAGELVQLKVAKDKQKQGVVERASNSQEVIVKDLFKKETNIALFSGLRVKLSTGEEGKVEGGFGQSGKVKVRVMEGLKEETMARLGTSKKKGKEAKEVVSGEEVTATIYFKRYVFDLQKKMIQS